MTARYKNTPDYQGTRIGSASAARPEQSFRQVLAFTSEGSRLSIQRQVLQALSLKTLFHRKEQPESWQVCVNPAMTAVLKTNWMPGEEQSEMRTGTEKDQ